MAVKLLEAVPPVPSLGPLAYLSSALSMMNMAVTIRNFLNEWLGPQGNTLPITPPSAAPSAVSTIAQVVAANAPAPIAQPVFLIAQAVPQSAPPAIQQDSIATTASRALAQAYILENLWSNLTLKYRVVVALAATIAGWRMWQSVVGGSGGGTTTVVVHNHIHPPKPEPTETDTNPDELDKLFGTIPARRAELMNKV